MNNIRQVQALNKRELENAVPPEASWHADYRDTAYIYIGGLPFDLSEGDILTIFSQYGEPVHINLIRDKDTGKSRGFAFLKYEDQRSTDLAVDNLGGATVLGRVLRVDHTRYKRRDDEEETDNVARLMGEDTAGGKAVDDRDTDDERTTRRKRRTSEPREEEARRRPKLKEELELEELIRTHDEEDPMKEFLIEEKKEEVARALERTRAIEKKSSRRRDSRERSSRHHRSHRRRKEASGSPIAREGISIAQRPPLDVQEKRQILQKQNAGRVQITRAEAQQGPRRPLSLDV
ncbi:hypothetical protein ASPACDRAFT_43530 [Aspergillus aculeatus ATCC 16872]|uniref:RRM domain-containing protein n=1 Tax=Aspergillus aculeatus (strain ATCC 16872 / CBS 172.66 / WB 5094) TaxID=690307 RepID=A0A1L9WUG6_ASPA1|nr:uncharacterized protein ASPACDRAFT_43530 [Aspergillus aculeatus ATCC 16872]OJJ99896.1 hypothetical protein ASPACDRAFT_43530 [Aspergillus aculeatus ATCC 16872]